MVSRSMPNMAIACQVSIGANASHGNVCSTNATRRLIEQRALILRSAQSASLEGCGKGPGCAASFETPPATAPQDEGAVIVSERREGLIAQLLAAAGRSQSYLRMLAPPPHVPLGLARFVAAVFANTVELYRLSGMAPLDQ